MASRRNSGSSSSDKDSGHKSTGIRIAVEGCGHGTLNNIYSSVTAACKAKSWPGVDLLIIGGDFQAVRNSYDLNAMAVPAKYRQIGDFHEYYSGKRKAPYLTIFIGGNHEASNHLTELYYGGWVAPNIYYMGATNVLQFGTLRIAGMSGIWKGYHYRKPHYERLPYMEDDKKSVYHVRELDVRKLLQIRSQVDIGLSHDWPEGIQWCGDWQTLFQHKKFLEEDARSGRLGNIAAKEVLQRLRPPYWFSAHMHTKFTAVVRYDEGHPVSSSTQPKASPIANGAEIDVDLDNLITGTKVSGEDKKNGSLANADEIQLDMDDIDGDIAASNGASANATETGNPDEIDIDLDDEPIENNSVLPKPTPRLYNDAEVSEDIRAQLPDSFKKPPPPEILPFPKDISNKETKFLALNKCLPNRDFLQLIDIPTSISAKELEKSRPFQLEYDKEWLAITRVFAKDVEFGNENSRVPRNLGEAEYRKRIGEQELWVQQHIVDENKMQIPENFELTAPVYDASIGIHTRERPIEYANPQTGRFCSLVGIDNPLDMSEEERNRRRVEGSRLQSQPQDRGYRGGGRGGGRGHYRGNSGRGRGRGR